MFCCCALEPKKTQFGGCTCTRNASRGCTLATASYCEASCKDSIPGSVWTHASMAYIFLMSYSDISKNWKGQNKHNTKIYKLELYLFNVVLNMISIVLLFTSYLITMLVIFNSDSHQVIHSARANASHNHGLDPDRLIVGMSFVFSFCFWGAFLCP